MRFVTVFTLLLLPAFVSAGKLTSVEIQLDKNISLAFTIEQFVKSEYKVTDCGGGYICLVNDKPLWGADGKLAESTLKNMLVNIKGRKIELDTAGMFNPMISMAGKHKFQVLNYYDDAWKVRGVFSDGAGTYYAEWLVANGNSMRIVIGDSELLHDAFTHIFNKK